ncbi:MAG TPA: ABC transporter substrate-binding protein [Spirochaetales bacterium]|nr:ABC transporter substrate-binding protein [Spirochaetales bacterium]HPS14662.1 ABC transporter substrate-binding protein [Spirochaetales bacterium]
MKLSFRIALSLLVLALAMPLAAQEKVLTIGVDQEAIGLDPHIITAFSSHRRVDLLYNKLVRHDENLKIVPDLAESWEVPNNTTYIFNLRKGVKFHTGQEMTSDDVIFSLNRILDPKTASPGRSYITSIKTMEALDKYRVKITLSAPLASFLEGLTSNNCAIVSKAAVEQYGNLQKVEAGTGAFMLKEWIPDNSMTLVKNPNYFEKGLPYMDKVIFRVIPEQASLFAGVRSGSLDIAQINDGGTVMLAKKDANLVVVQKPGINVRTFGFNVTRKPFDDVRVRQAISLAIDRNEIIAAAEFGMAQPSGPIPPGATQWATPVSKLPNYTPDIAKAKSLLAQAGYPNGFNFKIVCSNSFEGGLAVAQVIQNQLKKIGVTADLDVVEWGIYIDKWNKRDFDSMVELRGGSGEPDRFLYRTLHSTGGVNNFLFKDAEVDALLDKGRTLTDYAARKQVYDDLQAMLAQKAPVIFLYCPYETHIANKGLKGFKQIGDGSLYYVVETRE